MRVYALFGNMDLPDVRKLIEERGVSIHARRIELGAGWNLVGFGGSGPTPFGTPTEFPEDEIYEGLTGLAIDGKTILATHAPPYDVKLDYVKRKPAGSKAIRRIIEERRPAMNLCGHIHENEGEGRMGGTRIIKVGAAMRGRAVELEIGRGLKVGFIKL